MDLVGTIISYGALAFFAVALAYLIYKRVKDKKKETFEKRDN